MKKRGVSIALVAIAILSRLLARLFFALAPDTEVLIEAYVGGDGDAGQQGSLHRTRIGLAQSVGEDLAHQPEFIMATEKREHLEAASFQGQFGYAVAR